MPSLTRNLWTTPDAPARGKAPSSAWLLRRMGWSSTRANRSGELTRGGPAYRSRGWHRHGTSAITARPASGAGSCPISRGAEVVTFAGLRVSSPAQTFIDLATELSLVDLVVLGDSLVKKGRTTTRHLVEAALGWKGKGCRAARRAAALLRARVDSPMESRLRLLMVFAGLPEPVVNHIVYNARGAVSKRFDLSYPS